MPRSFVRPLLVSLCSTAAFAQAPTDAQRLATAINTFARDVHGALGATAPHVTSPTSIAVALAMLLPGARGETGNEIATMLHLPDDLRGPRLHAAVAELLDAACLVGLKINAPVDVPRPIVVANDLWVAKDAPLLPDYVTTLRRSFSAGYEAIDFHDPKAARAAINAAIARITHGRIRDLVPEGAIDATTTLVLTNALRVHATWESPFDAAATIDEAFTLADRTTVKVPTMHGVRHHEFAETDAVQGLAMNLEGVGLRCEIVVPKDGHPIADAERVLFDGNLKLRTERVDVALPRFEVRDTHRLVPVLQSLGMKTAFEARHADFGAMSTQPLFVGNVVHEAFVKIDEHGAEAAAATAMPMEPGARAPQDPPKVFRADRPFVFALRHAATGLLLFVGRIDDPRRT